VFKLTTHCCTSLLTAQVQGKDPSVEITQDVLEPETEEMDDDHFEDMHDTTAGVSLPPCELSRLEEISELFNASLLTPIKREKLTILIENEGYIKKLIDLFHMCEDLDNLEGLHHLYNIFKSLFLLNKTALFEIMFTDDMIFDVVGVLEYDPASQQPVRHREFLRTQTKLKEVIPLNNTELVQKIHQTYRVQYIQDMILPAPSVFEENLLSTLTSFIYFNKMEIVTMIQVCFSNFLQCLVFPYSSLECFHDMVLLCHHIMLFFNHVRRELLLPRQANAIICDHVHTTTFFHKRMIEITSHISSM